MAHREQHSNRETKKPKKDKPTNSGPAQASRWAVREALEPRTDTKR